MCFCVCTAGVSVGVARPDAGAAQRGAYKEVPLPGEQRLRGHVHKHVQGGSWLSAACLTCELLCKAGQVCAGSDACRKHVGKLIGKQVWFQSSLMPLLWQQDPLSLLLPARQPVL